MGYRVKFALFAILVKGQYRTFCKNFLSIGKATVYNKKPRSGRGAEGWQRGAPVVVVPPACIQAVGRLQLEGFGQLFFRFPFGDGGIDEP